MIIYLFLTDTSSSTQVASGSSSQQSATSKNSESEHLKKKIASVTSLILEDTNLTEILTSSSSQFLNNLPKFKL